MTSREAAAVLHCGWARKDTSGRWIVCAAKDGYLHWGLASAEDVTALEAELAAHPGLRAIHESRASATTGLPAEIAPQVP